MPPRTPRSEPRKLVRWDNEIDIMCYLAIPRIMARRGIKFPWGEVAAYVGPHVSGNALLQHMSKLSKNRTSMGQIVPEEKEPVGPPSDFAMIAAAGFGERKYANKSRPGNDDDDEFFGDAGLAPVTPKSSKKPTAVASGTSTPKRRAAPKTRGKAIKEEPTSDYDSSDPTPTPLRRRPAPRHAAKRSRDIARQDDSDADFEPDEGRAAIQKTMRRIKEEHGANPIDVENEPGKPSANVLALKFVHRKPHFIHKLTEWQQQENMKHVDISAVSNDFNFPDLNLGGMHSQTNQFSTLQDSPFDMSQFQTGFGNGTMSDFDSMMQLGSSYNHSDGLVANFHGPEIDPNNFQLFDHHSNDISIAMGNELGDVHNSN